MRHFFCNVALKLVTSALWQKLVYPKGTTPKGSDECTNSYNKRNKTIDSQMQDTTQKSQVIVKRKAVLQEQQC